MIALFLTPAGSLAQVNYMSYYVAPSVGHMTLIWYISGIVNMIALFLISVGTLVPVNTSLIYLPHTLGSA